MRWAMPLFKPIFAGICCALGLAWLAWSDASLGGRRAALVDACASPRPLKTYPLRGFRVDAESRIALLRRVANAVILKSFTAGHIHALRLLNLARATPRFEALADYERCLRWMTDSPSYTRSGSLLPLVIDTPHGAGYRTRVRDRGGVASPQDELLGGMTHVDKVLSVLGELGVPLSYRVVTDSGATYPLAAVLEDSLQRHHARREPEWSFVAYCEYLGRRTWTNDWGETFDLDQLLRRLLDQEPGAGPCLGGHRMYALAKACAAAEGSEGLFDPATIRRVEDHLRAASRALEASQAVDGSWGRDWPGPMAAPAPPIVEGPDAAPMESLTATSHHLEWIAIAPPRLRPPDPIVRRAADHLLRRLSTRATGEFCFNQGLLPTTHAVRALLHLSDDNGQGQEAIP